MNIMKIGILLKQKKKNKQASGYIIVISIQSEFDRNNINNDTTRESHKTIYYKFRL